MITSLCLSLCLAAGAGRAEPVGRVTNGSFEEVGPLGVPLDWSAVLGDVANRAEVCEEARTGRYSLRLLRAVDKGEVGFNRAWTANNGQQAKMLSQLKGGLVFRYKAVASRGSHLMFYAIPMNETPLEGTGAQRATFEVPAEHVGDGQWHKAVLAYDFTDNKQVKWVHVSGRLVGGTGEMLVDDVEYLDSVGPLPKILRTDLRESAGGTLTLTARFENAGDAAGDLDLALELPEGLSIRGDAPSALADLEVKGRRNVAWQLGGNRDAVGSVRLIARAGDNEVISRLPLRPELTATALKPDSLLLSRFHATNVTCILENTGHANLHSVAVALTLDPALGVDGGGAPNRAVDLIAPGATATVSWPVKALAESAGAALSAQVSAEGCPLQTTTNEIVVTAAEGEGEPWPAPAGKATAAVVKAGAVLENARLRAEFPRSSAGFGACRLFAKTGDDWRQVGVVTRLGKAVYLTNKGERQVLLFGGAGKLANEAGKSELTLTSRLRDADGATWDLVQTWTVTEEADTFAVSTRLHVNRPRKLTAFETLLLYAGAGSFGDAKSDALFPGLEWLVNEEVSSNDLDFAPAHPDRVRYVPHVNKITIPLMSVHEGSTTVGLLWDAYQKWDGRNDRPGAVFCSPDYKEGRVGHLMGFVLPTCPNWLDENTREAARPYEFVPKGALTIDAHVYLDGSARDSLSAMDRWFALYGVPDPLTPPRGTWQKEIDFSARAYLESLWVPEKKGWYSSRGGPKVMESIAPHGPYLYDVLMAERLTADAQLEGRLRRLAEEVQATGAAPAIEDYGITYGDPVASLDGAAAAVAGLLASQREDGSWRFDAKTPRVGVFEGMDYTLLGTHEAAEVGTCAQTAYTVLRFARVTGDAQALAGGEKALAFMDRFPVPRAAQVWEVPVHTPDLLAAADACEAYLTGYECTGNGVYLASAVKWARAGLPFLYMWDTPEYPFLRYASIPVFGATWLEGSWIGRPVQWNGLRHAYALLRLAEYDPSFPWEEVARGLTVSALFQQSTNASDIALWPDNISALNAEKCGWIFAPHQILRNVYRLLGSDQDPWTRTAVVGEGKVRLTSRGVLNSVTVTDDTVALSIRPPTKESCWLLVAGTAQPKSIRLNGSLLTQTDPPGLPDHPCYRYDPAHGALLIRLPAGQEAKLLLTGVEPLAVPYLPEQVTEIRFGPWESTQGWVSQHDLTPLRVEGSKLVTEVTGGDPYLVRPFVAVKGAEADVIEITMQAAGGSGGQFYWTTTASPGFAEDKVLLFPLVPGDRMQTYRVHVGTHPLWRDQQITSIRLDPGNGAAQGRVEIEHVTLLKLGE
ncbi:MAG: hypothetical protein COZ06_02160 [Armatimonadetes bacterium CG_4_10_14_3_um_filter_66_18]|nr:hypothetical protein [Armatimonadota bacterium]OIO99464.1 MAG: hypothetical protein AUJ96_19430 [Armatimonadetes bacterium CG2_30_66_41]PIU93694.1 MAG: hypothetical protein COS65_11520 [Armatimonadetes bacterium CG06_land_8_20_14_3_00_66_21]PIY53105.1 MAG: hypothetical protein COZ06_02160 [Armatimonadetes bacterium CG_4_10_14_3_um_filter_66_18]NCO92664.1 hypothetical protein [Armatimonadota bacterium]